MINTASWPPKAKVFEVFLAFAFCHGATWTPKNFGKAESDLFEYSKKTDGAFAEASFGEAGGLGERLYSLVSFADQSFHSINNGKIDPFLSETHFHEYIHNVKNNPQENP